MKCGKGEYLGGRKVKIADPRGNRVKVSFKPFLEAQKPVSPEGLHEALCRSFPEIILERRPIKIPFRHPIIKGQEFVLLTA